MKQHISVDLETLGTAHDAMILSIGAVKFDPNTGTLGDTFYAVIDIEAPGGGGTIAASTVNWWMGQSAAAREAVFGVEVDRVPLLQALIDFSEWIGFNDDLPEDKKFPDNVLWQRGDKDFAWMESAYQGLGIKPPFAFWQWENQRTLCRYVPGANTYATEQGVAHHALDDATGQALAIMGSLGWVQSAVRGVAESDRDGAE